MPVGRSGTPSKSVGQSQSQTLVQQTLVEQILQLNELMLKGVLSPEEFRDAKRLLLSGKAPAVAQ